MQLIKFKNNNKEHVFTDIHDRRPASMDDRVLLTARLKSYKPPEKLDFFLNQLILDPKLL